MNYYSNYEIDTGSIIKNIKYFRRFVKNGVKICAVVKCDAYGLGVQNIVPILNNYVDCYGVANFGESKIVRQLTNLPILVLGSIDLEEVEYSSTHNVSVSINNIEELMSIKNTLTNSVIKVHLKINTGMNRYGFKNKSNFLKALNIIKKCNNIILEGVYTHFATKQDDGEYMAKQLDIFKKFLNYVENKNDIVIHCASTYSTINNRPSHYNMVRIGYGLYDNMFDTIHLKNPLSITTKILHIQHLKKGEYVGYDNSFKANKKMKIAIIGIGYGDGLNLKLSNNFKLLVNGEWVSIVGKICMDVSIIDITNIKNVFVGTSVTILGKNLNQEILLRNYSDILDMSSYETLVNFNRKRMNVVVK